MNNRYQKIYFEWLVDILAYIVVLNLLTEHFHAFYVYNFTTSILVAISMKLILVPIVYLKSRVSAYWKTKEGWPSKVLGLLSKFAILFSSKFVVLAYLDYKYREYVRIEGFVSITILILLLMLTGKLFTFLNDYLGTIEPVKNAEGNLNSIK